jgi:serine/threonine protein kinase
VLTCAPPHRPTAHVEEFTPLTEDSLLFDGPRTTYGRVRVLHQIGAGSVGPVFRGEDPATRQPVVVKVLRVGLPPERVAIVAAALAAARDRLAANPALCPMLDTGVHEAEPFVVSAFVDGDSLDVALREYGPANITDALPRMRALADALDSAAAVGVTHGSLHLRDIIVSPEHTVLTGIGVASVLERVGVRPPVRRPYCAPEVAQGHGVSPAGDQFALAAIAHEWLSGRRISGPGAEGFHLPGTSAAGTEAVAAVFCRALDELPDARFPTATAFIDALAEVSDALAPRTRAAKRRPSPASEPRLAFDFLEDGADAPVVSGPRPDPIDDAPPALSFATLEDADAADDQVDDGAGAAAPIAAADVAEAADRNPLDEVVPADDAVAALESAHSSDALHPMADVMAAAPVDVTGPLIDLPDDPRPAEPPRTAPPPIVVRPPRARGAAPIVPDEPRESLPVEPPRFASPDDDAGTGWGAGRWALVLVVLAAVTVAGGAALVRWGTPSSTPTTQAVATDAATATSAAPSTPAPAASAPTSQPTATTQSPAAAAPAKTPASAPPSASSPAPPGAAPPAKAPIAPAARAAKAVPPRAPAKAPAAPVATAAVPKAAAAGRLLVRSTPAGAEVFVDGTRRGVTPLAVRDLPFGNHAVRITRAGFSAAEQRVTLDAGRPSRTVDVALARTAPAAAAAPVAASTPGSLTVDSRPAGARVLVDGREAGRTPLTVPSLPPGDYAVRIDLDGYQPITTTTRVEPGARARVAVSLTTERPR